MRRVRAEKARDALARAERAAHQAGIPALVAEVETASLLLNTPAARLIGGGRERLLLLAEVEALLKSEAFVVDACRHVMRQGDTVVPLATRPVLFALAQALGEAWPGDVPRDLLLARAFSAKLSDESHRARLRVEVGRLRRMLRRLADIAAMARGFVLAPRRACEVVVLLRPVETDHAAVPGFLADGESWSSSALALAIGTSQRTVQRALDSLAAAGKVQSFGRARARRWLTLPVPRFAATLLLPAPLPIDQFGIMQQWNAEIVREYGQQVWFAAGDTLNAFDPADGNLLRAIDVAAHAGTAFDGSHLFQLADDRIQKIDPKTGRVLTTIPAPDGGGDSGLAWAEGTLWVGQYQSRKIHPIDPETGEILRIIESNRFVTGVTWVDGELWHGTWEADESDVRRIDPRTGNVLEKLEMPSGVGVSGLESNGGDPFFCGGGKSGKVRAVRRPARDSASGSGSPTSVSFTRK